MKRKSVIAIAVAFFLSFCVGTGKSAWLIAASSKEYTNAQLTQGNVEGDKVVCYIDKDTTKNQYTSIEVALAKAKSTSGSQTVYVKPGLNSTIKIKRDCEIGAGDTLCLPYEGTTIHSFVNGGGHDVAYEHGTRTTYIEVSSGVTFTNNGTLTIGAIQNSGNGGTYPNGNAADKYTEMKLLGKAILINNGTINCYGYISGNNTFSKIVSNENSVVNRPFTVIEHRGGSRLAGMAGKDKNEIQNIVNSSLNIGYDQGKMGIANPVCFVFNRWYLDGFINIDFDFRYGSSLVGKAALFADKENNETDRKIISTDGLIQLGQNAIFSGHYKTSTKKCKIDTHGSWKLGNIDVSFAIQKEKYGITALVKIKIPSSNVFLPVPYYFDISALPFEDGSPAVIDATGQSFKLLPGASLLVQKGVTLNGNQIAIYSQDYLYPNGVSIEAGDIGCPIQYPNLEDSILKNYGIINGSAIGGKILNYSGTINSQKSSVDSKEPCNFKAETITVTVKILGFIKKNIDINIYIPSYVPSSSLSRKIINL